MAEVEKLVVGTIDEAAEGTDWLRIPDEGKHLVSAEFESVAGDAFSGTLHIQASTAGDEDGSEAADLEDASGVATVVMAANGQPDNRRKQLEIAGPCIVRAFCKTGNFAAGSVVVRLRDTGRIA